MKKYILLYVLTLLLTGCRLGHSVSSSDIASYNTQPDTTRLVSLPAPILYVLAREYESLNDSTKPKYYSPEGQYLRSTYSSNLKGYMEKRLIDLLPSHAYKGMLDKLHSTAVALIDSLPKQIKVNLNEFSGVYSSNQILQDDEYHYQSDMEEIQFLQLTNSEQFIYERLNALADSAGYASMKDFEHLTIEDSTWNLHSALLTDSLPYFIKENLTVSLLLSGMGSALFYRIIQSKARAEYVAEYYYPGGTKNGMRGDAFKHIYVNMMLRRYTSESLAWLIMDIYWEKVGNNAPCDMIMDLHNNQIGRNHRYWEFREDKIADRYNWQKWGHNIHEFIEDTTHNSAYQSWNKELPLHLILPMQESTNPSHYLYWNRSTQAE